MNADISSFYFLTEVFLKSGLVLLLGMAGARAFRRTSPEFRHRFWMLLFVLVLIAPALLLLPRWGLVPPFSSAAENPRLIPQAFEVPRGQTSLEAGVAPEPERVAAGKLDVLLLIPMVWAVGVIALLLRMMTGCLRVSHWRRRADQQTVPVSIRNRVEELRRELGISPHVAVILSDKVRSPFAWGWYHPLVALPGDAKTWRVTDLEMILRHELTHVAHGDCLSVWISGFVTALHWPNPLAWFASRHVTELREQICDREVVNAGFDSGCYAQLLFSHARRRMAPFPLSATAVARPGTLEKRIAMILKPNLPTSHPKNGLLCHLTLAGLLATSVCILILGVARPGIADETKVEIPANQKQIHITSRFIEVAENSKSERSPLLKKVDAIVLPSVEFNDTQLRDALQFLQQRSEELDSSTVDPTQKGVNLILKGDEGFQKTPLSLKLSNVPLAEVLHHVAQLAGAEVRVDGNAIFFQVRQGETVAGNALLLDDPALETKIVQKLEKMILPSVEFSETPLKDALNYLRMRSVELDLDTSNPKQKGVNIILVGDKDAKEKEERISLRLKNTSLGDVLRYAADLADHDLRIQGNSIVISAKEKATKE